MLPVVKLCRYKVGPLGWAHYARPLEGGGYATLCRAPFRYTEVWVRSRIHAYDVTCRTCSAAVIRLYGDERVSFEPADVFDIRKEAGRTDLVP